MIKLNGMAKPWHINIRSPFRAMHVTFSRRLGNSSSGHPIQAEQFLNKTESKIV